MGRTPAFRRKVPFPGPPPCRGSAGGTDTRAGLAHGTGARGGREASCAAGGLGPNGAFQDVIPTGDDPFHGIYAATPCPLGGGFAPDEPALAAHLDRLADVPGLAGFLLNGHAGENAVMARAHQERVVAAAAERVGSRSILVAGVNCEGSLEAARHARTLEAAGADALMVFPPNGWALHQDEDGVVDHHRRILDATGAPLMLFQAAVGAGGLAYRAPVLERLAQLPRVVAVKEGSWEVAAYEENRRLIRAIAPHVAVMGSGDEHLFTSFAIGSEGSIVSLAAVIPEPIIALFDAVGAGRLDEARACHERIHPLARAIYRLAPGGRATARLKTCLKLLGRFPNDAMLPPATATPSDEHPRLRRALEAALAP